MSSQTALLIGATGQVGSVVLKELLASKDFSKVVEAGRRVTPEDALEGLAGREKLVQLVVDFDKIEEARLNDTKADVVVITLGTYQKLVKTDADFVKIDHDYVVNAARAAQYDAANQRLVYLSSGYADPKSLFLYTRSKGQTEHDLALLGYKDFVVFQPGVLLGTKRDYFHTGESFAGTIAKIFTPLQSSLGIWITDLGKTIRLAATTGSGGIPPVASPKLSTASGIPPYTILLNKPLVKWAKTAST